MKATGIIAGMLAIVGLVALCWWSPWSSSMASRQAGTSLSHVAPPPDAVRSESAHYIVHSTATPEQTQRVVAAVESLHAAYRTMLPEVPPSPASSGKLSLVLYRDRQEFSRNNRSRPWAEAYYLAPACHAYYADGANPYHWMLHEATHQLNAEAAGLTLPPWANEGLASYFGASWLQDGALSPGRGDPQAYPLWWLSRMAVSGDLARDVAAGRIIPLRQLISGKGGPDIDRHVNLYYLHYWSLTHFLFHAEDGRHADAYRALLRAGGSLDDFERLIGPVDEIEPQWYAYLVAAVEQMRRHEADARIVRGQPRTR